jgi:predicted Rossmann-fold nucleotide-binding protein
MLVYGGGRVGLRSVVENVVLDAGGEATGVIP